MKESFQMVSKMEKDFRYIKMETSTKESFRTIKCTETESIFLLKTNRSKLGFFK